MKLFEITKMDLKKKIFIEKTKSDQSQSIVKPKKKMQQNSNMRERDFQR